MKKYSLLIASAALVFFSACSVKVSTDDKGVEEKAMEEATGGGPKVAKVTDPVCGMAREAGENWTEYAVKGSDTTWFCSPHCKETYEKHPEKYQAKPAPEQKG